MKERTPTTQIESTLATIRVLVLHDHSLHSLRRAMNLQVIFRQSQILPAVRAANKNRGPGVGVGDEQRKSTEEHTPSIPCGLGYLLFSTLNGLQDLKQQPCELSDIGGQKESTAEEETMGRVPGHLVKGVNAPMPKPGSGGPTR